MRIVAGRLKGRAILAPAGRDLRPTADRTRESLFNILAHGMPGLSLVGASVIDGFCGTGAVGIEALSRGAASVLLIDRDTKPAEANLRSLDLADGKARLLRADMTDLPAASAAAEIVFLDPPYKQGLVCPALASLLARGYLAPGAVVAAEVERSEEIAPLAGFVLLDERRYGKAKLIFWRYS